MAETNPRILSPDHVLCIANTALKKERRNFIIDDYVMVLVTSGHGTYLEEDTGKTHVINQGDIMQRFPGRSHAQIFDSDNNSQFFVKVPASLYALLAERGLIMPQPVLHMRNNKAFAKYDHCLRDCLQHKHDPNYCLWRMKDLIVDLHKSSKPPQQDSDIISEAQRQMQLHVHTSIHIPDIATSLHMSYIHFRRLFKQRTGLSPGAWFIKQRINKACQLLKNDEFSITHISDLLGYADVFTFSKQFKKEMGVSPSYYAINARADTNYGSLYPK